MGKVILGISAFYHDSAAALIRDGRIVAAAQEERFTRRKNDERFPSAAILYVLSEAQLSMAQVDAVVFYDKPFLKFERLLETYHALAPKGLRSFMASAPVWIKDKLFIKSRIQTALRSLSNFVPPIYFSEHHLSHAASAFYPSPFKTAAILTVDGVGEWSTTTIGKGEGREVQVLREMTFPHSLGLLYSAVTAYLGFKVNSGEYKLMGLAPYGNPGAAQTKTFHEAILKNLIDLKEDGSFYLNMKYFAFATDLKMYEEKKWRALFGFGPRSPEAPFVSEHLNLALAIQQVTEEVMLRLARTARHLTQAEHLVMAGGVALNSVANGRIVREKIFKEVWIQPAAGDAGGAVGAALAAHHIFFAQPRSAPVEGMSGAYLGPEFSEHEILQMAARHQALFEKWSDEDVYRKVADLLEQGKVVAWFQGRMEFGPRALGNRSILADARNPEMQKIVNLKVKFREGFRPFAPAVQEEYAKDYFELEGVSPYMLLVVPVRAEHRHTLPMGYETWSVNERLNFVRSFIPAVTHVDFTARVQTVSKSTNPRFWALLEAFRQKTGTGLLLNTSFNVRGEPIVCTPEEAYQCFMKTEIDVLVMNSGGTWILFPKRCVL